jgi:hypothetical protein
MLRRCSDALDPWRTLAKLNPACLQPTAVFSPLRLGSVMKRCLGSTEKPLRSTPIVTTAGLLLLSADSGTTPSWADCTLTNQEYHPDGKTQRHNMVLVVTSGRLVWSILTEATRLLRVCVLGSATTLRHINREDSQVE